MKNCVKKLAVLSLTLLTLNAFAQEDSKAEPPSEQYLIGPLIGERENLSKAGLDFSLVYKGEYHQVLSGGIEKKAEYLGNIDLIINIDFEKAFNWKGLTSSIYVLENHGDHPSRSVGDAQVTSSIESTSNDTKIFELWIQKANDANNMSVLFGLHDLNSEFYNTESSALFFNSSFGIGAEISQTGTAGPSIFPFTSPALRFKAEPTKSLYLQAAAFSASAGNPPDYMGTHSKLDLEDGQLIIAETGYMAGKEDEKDLPSKYAFGLWAYTTLFDSYDGSEKVNSNGFYILADQNITKDHSFFLKYGITSSLSNRFNSCLTSGFVFTGLIPGRSEDQLGLGVAIAQNNPKYKTFAQANLGTDPSDSETALELNYRAGVYNGIFVQPSFQWIKNPNTDSNASDVSVAQLRLELNL